jgi:hypothetical protein
MVCLTQTEHQSFTDANTISNIDRNEIPHNSRQLGVPSSVSNTISKLMIRSTQIVHQSCIKSSTISKLTKPSFHLSLITKESYRVRHKRFICLWSARSKPWSYLALTLTLSLNGLKWDSTWPRHLRVPSGASKTIYDLGYVQCKPCTYLV